MRKGSQQSGEVGNDAQLAVHPRLYALTHEKLEIRFFHLFWIFMLTSVVGLFVETAVSFPIDGIWKSRSGFVWGPLSPIYGVGAVLMTVFLERLRECKPVVIFIVASLLGGIFEYIAGTFFQSVFGINAWDYTGQFLCFNGKTCLAIALVWGAIGAIWAMFVLPATVHLIEKMPQRLRTPLTAVFLAFVLIDTAATLVAFDCWYLRSAGVPVEGPVQQFCASVFPDGFMQDRFQTMSIVTQLATAR